MSCSNCKKKNIIPDNVVKQAKNAGKGALWIIIIWLLFGAYGLYCLIKDIIELL